MLNIFVVGVILFIFNAVWYTVLFGRKWARLNGFDTKGDIGMKSMAKPLVINFILNLFITFSIYYLFPQILAISYFHFWKTMIVVWFGLSFPIYMNQYLWERKPFQLVLLNSAYGLIMVTLLTGFVFYWHI